MTNGNIPRLTEIGDTFTGKVAKCWPENDSKGFPYVHFTFHHFDGDLKIGAMGCNGKLIAMGFHDAPDADHPDGVIRYDEVADEELTFARVGPARGGNPLWRIEKAGKPAAVAPVSPKPATRAPEGKAVPVPPAAQVGERTERGSRPGAREAPKDTTTPEQRRAMANARFDEQAVRIVTVTIPAVMKAAKKAKIKLPAPTWEAIFSAASGNVIALEKRGAA